MLTPDQLRADLEEGLAIGGRLRGGHTYAN